MSLEAIAQKPVAEFMAGYRARWKPRNPIVPKSGTFTLTLSYDGRGFYDVIQSTEQVAA